MKIVGLSKSYKIKGGEVRAVTDVSLELPEKGLVLIAGKSGSGKSTLLNILGGLERADSGSIQTDGIEVTALSGKELDIYRGEYCGIIFQEYNLLPELSVGENIGLSLEIRGGKASAEEISEALKSVELEGYEKRKVTALSGGQKQRVAIAVAVIKKPRLILADEPTGALDGETGENIIKILKSMSKDSLVILVSHDRELTEKYADRVIVMSEGGIESDSGENVGKLSESKEFRLEKTRAGIPIKAAIKIGCGNFKSHPVRLLATILLAVIAFTLLGTSLSGIFIDKTEIYISALYENEIATSQIKKHRLDTDSSFNIYEAVLGVDQRYYKECMLTVDDLNEIREKTDSPVVGVIDCISNYFQSDFYRSRDAILELHLKTGKWYSVGNKGYMVADEETFNKLGFTVTGTLPRSADEIAVDEHVYNSFNAFGLNDDGKLIEIGSKEDFIGKKFEISPDVYKTVTAVVDTGCNSDCLFHGASEMHVFHDKLFISEEMVSEGFFNGNNVPAYDGLTSIVVATNSDKAVERRLADYVLNYDRDDCILNFSNGITRDFYYAIEFDAPVLRTVCLILCIVFTAFVIVMMYNYVTASLRGQLKQIGILSAKGVSFRGLVKIYLLSVMLVAVAVLGLSLALVPAVNAIVNSKKFIGVSPVKLLRFNVVIPPVLAVIIFAVVCAGCLFSIMKFRKDTPAELIRKGQIK